MIANILIVVTVCANGYMLLSPSSSADNRAFAVANLVLLATVMALS
ncbi:MAG: hypothetical protein ACSLE1_15845 [Sphingobium sp.]